MVTTGEGRFRDRGKSQLRARASEAPKRGEGRTPSSDLTTSCRLPCPQWGWFVFSGVASHAHVISTSALP